jgi:hypothetical protein
VPGAPFFALFAKEDSTVASRLGFFERLLHGRVPQRLKPHSLIFTLIGTSGTRALPDPLLYAALKRRSSTGLHRAVHASGGVKIKIETRSKERSKSKSKAAASALHWPVYFRGLYVLSIAWESGVGSENCAALGAAFFVGAQNARGLGRTP